MGKKELIIQSAKTAFRQKGINNATLDDVGRLCNMKKNSLYYYFKNKDDLVSITLHSEYEDMISWCKELFSKNLSLKDFLKQYINYRYVNAMKFIKEYEFMKKDTPHSYQKLFRNETEFLIKEETKIIEQLVKNSVSEDTDQKALVKFIVSINQGVVSKNLFVEKAPNNIENDIDNMLNFLFNGITLK